MLDGAAECVAAGVLSSIHSQNAKASAAVQNAEHAIQHESWPLLVDPQTGQGSCCSCLFQSNKLPQHVSTPSMQYACMQNPAILLTEPARAIMSVALLSCGSVIIIYRRSSASQQLTAVSVLQEVAC